jgi:hypothetical protein
VDEEDEKMIEIEDNDQRIGQADDEEPSASSSSSSSNIICTKTKASGKFLVDQKRGKAGMTTQPIESATKVS